MLEIINNETLSNPITYGTTAEAVKFDTVIARTNNRAALVDNAVQISAPGWYSAHCELTISNAGSSAVNATLQMTADGKPLTDTLRVVTVPATGNAEIFTSRSIQVVGASGGVAKIGWTLRAGANVSLLTASARVQGIA